MDILQKLLNKEQSKSSLIGSGSVAQKGPTCHALNATKDYDTSWIVDLGASDHVTGNLTLFQSYQPCIERHKIEIADGSFSRVASKGKVILPNKNLTCNLLLISQLTRDLHCVTKFSPAYCEFQEMESGRTIGCAWASNGLYIINHEAESRQA